jgi:hypothetical protein
VKTGGVIRDAVPVSLYSQVKSTVRSPSYSTRNSVVTLTSNPCRWSYDNFDVCLICMFIPPLGFNRPINRCRQGVAGVRIFRRSVRPRENPKRGFWCCCCSHDEI